MLKSFAGGAEHIVLATGATDFRKQITSLSAMVTMPYHMDPFTAGYVFLFCNRRRNAIKVLRYDKNGFVLATKKVTGWNEIPVAKKYRGGKRNNRSTA